MYKYLSLRRPVRSLLLLERTSLILTSQRIFLMSFGIFFETEIKEIQSKDLVPFQKSYSPDVYNVSTSSTGFKNQKKEKEIFSEILGILWWLLPYFKKVLQSLQVSMIDMFSDACDINETLKHRPLVSWLNLRKLCFSALLETHIKEVNMSYIPGTIGTIGMEWKAISNSLFRNW